MRHNESVGEAASSQTWRVILTAWTQHGWQRQLLLHSLLTLSSCHPFDADPPQREHGAVVVDVQEGDLVELLPQDEKHCVQILDALWDEIPPQSAGHLSHTRTWEMSRTAWRKPGSQMQAETKGRRQQRKVLQLQVSFPTVTWHWPGLACVWPLRHGGRKEGETQHLAWLGCSTLFVSW